MLPVLWGVIGSYATLAEQPVWALATKEFDKEYQFNQKWLELLPKLAELAAAEGYIIYLDEAVRTSGALTYDAAHKARLAAAAKGCVDALDWLERHQPIKHAYMAGYGDYMGEEDVSLDPTDAARVWVAGAEHPAVRDWAWNIANQHLGAIHEINMREEPIYHENARVYHVPVEEDGERQMRFYNAAIMIAAGQGKLFALRFLYEKLGDSRFDKYGVMRTAIANGSAITVKWCDELAPGACEGQRGNAVSIAATNEQLDMVRLLVEKKYYVSQHEACNNTANIEILRYFVSIGCELTESTYLMVAAFGSVSTLEWLHEQKCPHNKGRALNDAIMNSNYPVVQYFLNTGQYPANESLEIASFNGDLRMIRLCREYGIKWSGMEIVKAATGNHISTLELLRSLGAPLHAGACNAALKGQNYEAYLWLRKAGCPKNVLTEKLLQRIVPPFVRDEERAQCGSK